MNPPSVWDVLQFDQLRGLNSTQLQLVAAAAISNMPIPIFSLSSSEEGLSENSMDDPSAATVPESINTLELDSPITTQLKASELRPIPETFPKFKQLCVELRDMIWRLSLPGPRIVDIIYDKDQDRYFSFRSKIPSHLHTNKEARCVAQKIYNLCFPTQSFMANIYIRFDIDVVYFANWLTGYKSAQSGWFEHVNIGPIGKKGLGKEDLKSIQRVAVNSIYFDIPRPSIDKTEYFVRSVMPVLDRFYSLKKLYVVVEDIDPYQRGEITFVKIPHNCHLHLELCVFCGASEIVEEFGDVKWNLTAPWKVPQVCVVGAARNNHISHMGQHQKCECNGVPLPPGLNFRKHPCGEYIPSAVHVAGVDAEDESAVEDELPEENWGLEENELEELINDEDNYLHYVENICEGAYGVNHEQWVGIEYLLSRVSL